VPPLISAALVSLLVVGAGLSIFLRQGSETEVVPAEAGYSFISGGGSAALAAVPGHGAVIPGVGARVPGAGTRVPGAESRIP
jgi:hypothetical protein